MAPPKYKLEKDMHGRALRTLLIESVMPWIICLGNLSGDELLSLARAIHGTQVDPRTSRDALIKTIKDSFSVEEIRRKISEET